MVANDRLSDHKYTPVFRMLGYAYDNNGPRVGTLGAKLGSCLKRRPASSGPCAYLLGDGEKARAIIPDPLNNETE